MGQYYFARWRVLCHLLGSVTLPELGRSAAGRVGGRVADTAGRDSTVMPH